MKVMHVEVTIEQSAVVTIECPDDWEPARMQQEFSDQRVLMDALECAAPCIAETSLEELLWEPVGNLTVTHIRRAKPDAKVDYSFPDENQPIQLGLLDAA